MHFVRRLLEDYTPKHADPGNVRLHMLAVPVALFAILTLASLARVHVGAAAHTISLSMVMIPLMIVAYLSTSFVTGLVLALLLVPLGFAANVVAVQQPPWLMAVSSVVALLLAIAVQGRGHRREVIQPKLAGPVDAIVRLSREQVLLAPLFLVGRLTGFRVEGITARPT